MSKAVKAMITTELRERYSGVDSMCVVDFTGLNVREQEKLRWSLRESNSRMEVIKNSLARRAFQDTLLAPIGDVLEGPCALVTSPDAPIETARALVKAAEEFTQLQLKQAMIEGDPELVTVERLAKMLGRRELVGQVAMLIASPGRGVSACIASPQAKIAGCLKAIADREAE